MNQNEPHITLSIFSFSLLLTACFIAGRIAALMLR